MRGKSSYPHDCYFFIVKSLTDTEYFFIGNCKFFHRFSTKCSLKYNILNFEKILCVGSSCRGHLDMEMVVYSEIAKIRPSYVKIWRTQVPWGKSAYPLRI